jgi:phage major head subunit gpT-like protein
MDVSGLSSRAIVGEYYAKLETPAIGWIEPLSFMFDSNMPIETYKWLGQSPAMRQWLGGRGLKGLNVNGISIANNLYEGSLEIDGEDFRRDKTGQVLVRVADLARRTQTHWASLLSTLILNGSTTACYDGQNFFSTGHVEGDNQTAQSNLLTITMSGLVSPQTASLGTTTNPGALAMQQGILMGVQQILGFLDDRGEPMNEDAKQFTVMVPVPYWHAAKAAVGVPTLTGSESNLIPVLGSVDNFNISVVANPRLNWTDKFAIFRSDGSVKPFIRQDEYAPMLALLDENSEYFALNHKLIFGVNVSRGVGYGYWQQAVRVQFT